MKLANYINLVRYGAKWRLPGGRVDLHETIAQAAERELFEECGIKAKFESILGFRETLQIFIKIRKSTVLF